MCVLPLLAVMARWESATIGRRVEAARKVMHQQGRWGGGRRPFGYDVIDREHGHGKRIAVNADVAAIVRTGAAETTWGLPGCSGLRGRRSSGLVETRERGGAGSLAQ